METKFRTIDDLIANTPNTFKNRKANEKDLDKMAQWIAILSKFHRVKGLEKTELDMPEERLGNNLPAEITILYQSIGKDIDELAKGTLKQQKFMLLALENFWIAKDVVVKDYYTGECLFTTDILIYATASPIKKPLYGIDLKNGWDLSFQKDWFWQKDGMSLFQKLTTLFANCIISNKENIVKTKVKGITGIKRDKKAEEKFEGILTRLPDFEYYEHTIFYSEELDLIGWFRAGNAPDFLMGSSSKSNLDGLIHKFDFSSARFLKNDDK